MKKILFAAIAFFLMAAAGFSQDAEKEMKAAKKAYGAYNLDQTNNKAKLAEAVTAVDNAVSMGEPSASLLNMKGDIYNEIATQIVLAKQTGLTKPEDLPAVDQPAVKAAEAYLAAIPKAEKKYDKTDAFKGLQVVQSNLANMAVDYYDNGKFAEALACFETTVKAHDALKAAGEKSSLDEAVAYNDQLFYIGLSALQGGITDKAKEYFKKLYEMKYDKSTVYDALYTLEYDDKDPQKSYKYIEEGRKQFPDDISLLFSDINHHLKINKLEILLEKLDQAKAKEPNNASLYSTSGNVYDNLQQKEFAAGNKEKSEEYFRNALENFQKALEIKPDYFDAVYSIGALYYNRAAAMSQELKVEEEKADYSKTHLQKLEGMRDKILAEFDQALPSFKQAEKLNPNDVNTLIALKEIFARKDDFEKSNEFKARLEKVQAGGKNDKPYFN